MKNILQQINSTSLIPSFGAPLNAEPKVGPSGEWDSDGRPVDIIARKLYLNFYQGKKTSRMKTPEQIFAEPIKLGVLKIIRRRGKGPQVVWLLKR